MLHSPCTRPQPSGLAAGSEHMQPVIARVLSCGEADQVRKRTTHAVVPAARLTVYHLNLETTRRLKTTGPVA